MGYFYAEYAHDVLVLPYIMQIVMMLKLFYCLWFCAVDLGGHRLDTPMGILLAVRLAKSTQHIMLTNDY